MFGVVLISKLQLFNTEVLNLLNFVLLNGVIILSYFKRNNVFLDRYRLVIMGVVICLLLLHNSSLKVKAQNLGFPVEIKTGENYNTVVPKNIGFYNIGNRFMLEQTGQSSWYGKKFHNRKTANGERYDMYAYSAAHRDLPFGSIIKVTKTETGKSALLRVNDRGPYSKNRIIDMSYTSAEEIDALGVEEVKVESLMPNEETEFILDSIYYFGYSTTLPLVCIPSNIVKIIRKSQDFEEALNLYKLNAAENPGKLVYLFTKATKIVDKVVNDTETYYVGVFDPDQNLNAINEVVEIK